MHKALQLLKAGQKVLFIVCTPHPQVDMPLSVSLKNTFNTAIKEGKFKKELLEFMQIDFDDLPELVKENIAGRNIFVDEAGLDYESDGDDGEDAREDKEETESNISHVSASTEEDSDLDVETEAFDWLRDVKSSVNSFHFWIAVDPFFFNTLPDDLATLSTKLGKCFRNEQNIIHYIHPDLVEADPDNPDCSVIGPDFNERASSEHSKVTTVIFADDGCGDALRAAVTKTVLMAETKVKSVLWVMGEKTRSRCLLYTTYI